MADRDHDRTHPSRRFTDDQMAFSSQLGEEVMVEGRFQGTTNLEIWGSFEGEMVVDGLVWLRPGGRFSGELTVTDLVVEGELHGTVSAASKIDLRATCRVEADLAAARVAAAEGSHIEGQISVSGPGDAVVEYNERRES